MVQDKGFSSPGDAAPQAHTEPSWRLSGLVLRWLEKRRTHGVSTGYPSLLNVVLFSIGNQPQTQPTVFFRPRTPKTQPPALPAVPRAMLYAGHVSLQDTHWPGTSFGGHSSPFWQVLEARDHKWSNRGSNMYQPIKLAAAQSTPWRLGLRAPISLPAAGGRMGGGLPWGTIPE